MEWISVEDELPPLGQVWTEWDDGRREIATYHEYPHKNVFQAKCGTDEGHFGWDGNVGFVVRWKPV